MLSESLLLLCVGILQAGDPSQRFVYPDKAGKLVYDTDTRGNRIPDFSHCGYMGGGVAIPDAPVQVVVARGKGDSTARIQAAIDYVSKLSPDRSDIRGTVLLLAGRHEVAGQLRITKSGVILRGQGEGKTALVATGTDRRTLIQIRGGDDLASSLDLTAVADKYVPIAATRLTLESAKGLDVGGRIFITHPSTKKWIAALGMDRFPTDDKGSWQDWRPGTLDVRSYRVITKIEGDVITFDVPLTTALDAAFGQAKVRLNPWPARIYQVGVENLRCESEYDRGNPLDEEHAWNAIGMEYVDNAWVRQVTVAHFAGSAVAIRESCKQITVADCTSVSPVSEIGGYRRHTFYTNGQMTLFLRCKAEQGRHDFAVGHLAPGPNAFVQCQAMNAHHFSGPIESWATGVLYDNVTMDGGGLALTNRETDGHGVGWAAANCVLWQCTAPVITCRKPPTADNWAIGCWGQFVGDGRWRSMNEFVKPDSLYFAQLSERRGADAVENIKRTAIISEPGDGKSIDVAAREDPSLTRRVGKTLSVENGWLVCDGKLLTGGRTGTVWWRGHILPARAGELGVGITRFVPGRVGRGFTDDLDELAEDMKRKNQAILEHHWGLWYDRRRDDHQMVRRADGEVWPPFYEQPWARSGQGKAWDGLSKYDLTRFNPWYFGRLKQFADVCDRKGIVLVQQMYFQHNVLEAGAHWADFPWRSANCLQETGFPEPPPYVNNKRIFMAEAFYDVTHPVRRELHRAYIRHCLDALGDNTNVIFQTGEEYTGPLSFIQFWLDTIADWQKDKGKKVLVGLSCTKDVQDAILADKTRASLVSVIDMRYWWYTSNGGVYDPKGGDNLAPRQQLREWKGGKSRSPASIARQIREYRDLYPDKAILCSLDNAGGWTALAAGASAPNVAKHGALLEAVPRMKPFAAGEGQWALADPGRDYLVYSTSNEVRLDLSAATGAFAAWWVNLKTGEHTKADDTLAGGRSLTIRRSGPSLLWVTRP